MTAPTLLPARLGQVNGAGADTLALFDDEFTAEVRHTFQTKSAFINRQRIRRIRNAKSATFSSYGRLTGSYHLPGAAVIGQNTLKAETTIGVNNVFTVPVWIPNIDEAMSNLDDRAEIRTELAYGLQRPYDIEVARTLVLGARRPSDLASRPGGRTGGRPGTAMPQPFQTNPIPVWTGVGSANWGVDVRLRGASAKTNAISLRTIISNARLTLDEDDIPEDDGMTFCALRPAQYHLLARIGSDEMNRDFGGNGSAAESYLPMIAGIKLVKTNHLPTANLEAADQLAGGPYNFLPGITLANTAISVPFANTVGLVWHASAAGTVQLFDVTYESEYTVERQATLLLGKYCFGHGVLRPEAIRELTEG